MELGAEHEGVVPQLGDLDERSIRRQAAGDEAYSLQRFSIRHVELVPVSMRSLTSSVP
jgi:hypothetical protein